MSSEEKKELKTTPLRSEIKESDTWDLSRLCSSPEEWDKLFEELSAYVDKVKEYRGKLVDNPETLRKFLDLNNVIGKLEERVGYYAFLRTSEDEGSSEHQSRQSRYSQLAATLGAARSFVEPEILALDDSRMKEFLEAECLKEFVFPLKKVFRNKEHTLSEPEEAILARQSESAQTAHNVFSALTNVDLSFGTIEADDQILPLTQSTFSMFMQHQKRTIREKAYHQFYKQFKSFEHTIAQCYAGSVKQDIFVSKVKKYPSALEMSLFDDNVPVSVYKNLIEAVHGSLKEVHKYYELRRKVLGLETLSHFDTRVPLIGDVRQVHTYEQAVDVCMEALKPLGTEYSNVLKEGLLKKRWTDRYENQGKRSGAFSAGSFVGEPYILLNFKEDVFDDVFTLIHEAGHSMHSYFSAKSNPFQTYDYTIFVAEVASTFNEQLLSRHFLATVKDEKLRAYIINKQIDDIIGTLIRQTMFGEFELIMHEKEESGNPITVDLMKEEYEKLLRLYFGPDVNLPEESCLECLRIPHFYRAFYVYKYATGLSAAISLSERVINGGEAELKEYLNFLCSGGSAFPLDELKAAGVDMTTTEPVTMALARFRTLVDELDSLLAKK